MISMVEQLETAGFAVVAGVIDIGKIGRLAAAVEAVNDGRERGGVRNLLEVSEVAALAWSREIRALIEPVLGANAFPVRGLLFDKTPEANWKVPWHQDLSIAVQEKIETPGFGPWSVKAGVIHVQPPVEVLEAMLAVRVHFDDCGEENGPLRVIAGSHVYGRLSGAQIDALRDSSVAVECPVAKGGVILMRPLLLHAPSVALSPLHRRVVHLEFASGPLPMGLRWMN